MSIYTYVHVCVCVYTFYIYKTERKTNTLIKCIVLGAFCYARNSIASNFECTSRARLVGDFLHGFVRISISKVVFVGRGIVVVHIGRYEQIIYRVNRVRDVLNTHFTPWKTCVSRSFKTISRLDCRYSEYRSRVTRSYGVDKRVIANVTRSVSLHSRYDHATDYVDTGLGSLVEYDKNVTSQRSKEISAVT